MADIVPTKQGIHAHYENAAPSPARQVELAFRLAAECADWIAALAPVAGHCWIDDPQPERPVPTLYLTGVDDPLIPLAGGRVRTPWGWVEEKPSVAATLDSEDGVRILVARGVPVDGLDRNGETALFAAAAAGSVRAGEALLALGASADVVVESRRGPSWTPLFIATAEGRGEVVALLLSAPSTSAAGRGLSRVDATDRYGRTPLFYAAIHGQSSILQTLLTAGASAAHADAEGRTALDAATSAGRGDDTALLSIAAQTQAIDTGKGER